MTAAKACPFVWYELMTSNAAGAEAFYTQVVGWTAQDAGTPGMRYTLLSANTAMIGGLMDLPPQAAAAGARPAWTGYVAVEGVDAAAASVVAAGGAICKPADDIPGVGRFALVADPQGALFYLFTPRPGEPPAAPPPPGTPGLIGWHELHTTDLVGALAFYQGQFGWQKSQALDMGPAGVYQLFSMAGEQAVGGMLNRLPDMPRTCWLYYFNVAEIGAAISRVRDAGGTVLMGPREVPGGGWIAQCLDPQGAAFALWGPKSIS